MNKLIILSIFFFSLNNFAASESTEGCFHGTFNPKNFIICPGQKAYLFAGYSAGFGTLVDVLSFEPTGDGYVNYDGMKVRVIPEIELAKTAGCVLNRNSNTEVCVGEKITPKAMWQVTYRDPSIINKMTNLKIVGLTDTAAAIVQRDSTNSKTEESCAEDASNNPFLLENYEYEVQK